MSCLDIIRAARDEMSVNEKKLADFILENAPLVRDYSSQQIAASVSVSQSSVVKFSQKLGYKGFTDLKLAIHEHVIKQGTNVAQLRAAGADERQHDEPRGRLVNDKYDALVSTTDLNPVATVRRVAALLTAAERILVVAADDADRAAGDLAERLMRMAKPVIRSSDTQLLADSAMQLADGDCIVALSSAGQEPNVVQLVRRARKAGVAIVSITEQGGNPIGAMAELSLYTVARNSSRQAAREIEALSRQHVIDLIGLELTSADAAGLQPATRSKSR